MKRDGSEINTPDGSRTYGPLLSHKFVYLIFPLKGNDFGDQYKWINDFKFRFLEQEVESLRAVMELRNQEINQLRMHNDHMEKQVPLWFLFIKLII